LPLRVDVEQALLAAFILTFDDNLPGRRMLQGTSGETESGVGVNADCPEFVGNTIDCNIIVNGVDDDVEIASEYFKDTSADTFTSAVQNGIPGSTLNNVESEIILDVITPSDAPTAANFTGRRLDDFETDCTCNDNDIISCTSSFAELECSCEDGDIICEDSSLVW